MKEKGLSQSFISEKIGMSRNYIKDCKRLNTDIPDDRLAKIAHILGTTTEYLCDHTEDPSPERKKPVAISDELWDALNHNPKAVELFEMIVRNPGLMDALEKAVIKQEF
jgi:transcriptional regulator with XRE-family HTH domain